MAHVEKEAEARENRGVFVDTPINNQAGIAFYNDQGYAEAYTMPSYYDDELDGVAFIKLFKSHVESVS